MNWIISKIVGSPYVLIALLIAAFFAGGSASWWVQGLRITAVKQEHTEFVQSLKDQEQVAREEADKQREEASKEYAKLKGKLDDEIKSGIVFKRCVAAGKCGVCSTSIGQAIRLPTASGIDATSADSILAGLTGSTVAEDCAVTTLMINQLQSDIENQKGYK